VIHEWRGNTPLDLGTDHIDDFVGQAGDVLVAKVYGDARLLRLLRLQVSRGIGGLGSTVGDVVARLLESSLGEGHDIVIGDGRGRVVAHGKRDEERGQWVSERKLLLMVQM